MAHSSPRTSLFWYPTLILSPPALSLPTQTRRYPFLEPSLLTSSAILPAERLKPRPRRYSNPGPSPSSPAPTVTHRRCLPLNPPPLSAAVACRRHCRLPPLSSPAAVVVTRRRTCQTRRRRRIVVACEGAETLHLSSCRPSCRRHRPLYKPCLAIRPPNAIHLWDRKNQPSRCPSPRSPPPPQAMPPL
jgi:hypothetical protein